MKNKSQYAANLAVAETPTQCAAEWDIEEAVSLAVCCLLGHI